ncbi:serine/threonine protein phosphatase [Methanoculleus taiwanensis]|uniref:Serine/threonine protein phosphatase n=1 Tax=Methanoculleus taiwanensis TaxID=1550565 RepID=A0A498GZV6_9EURY|nr:SpoIIE family protein phosphatase [Methanoculleus taiwanensis]RXE56062.1 serine/threonine protein phosphatase [Methanoculleus taiwanensis]
MNPGGEKRFCIGLSVGTKIFLAFLGLSTAALLLAGILAFVQTDDVSRYALQQSTALGDRAADSTAALEESAEESLLMLAADQAAISNILFEQVSGEVDIMAAYAGEIMHDPARVVGRQHPASLLFLAPGTEGSVTVDEQTAVGMMEGIFRPIADADSHLSSVYLGTDSGIALVYPQTTDRNASFDPRLRNWFVQARTTGETSWSEPYVDFLGHGLTVACSKPVADTGSGWVWVVGADVTIETINRNIIGTQVGDRGYAILIDRHGNVVSRPDLTAGDLRWDESFVTENLFASSNTGLVSVAAKMTAGETGVTRVMFADGERFVAYAPVESVNWSVGVVMPVDEITAPITATRERILQASEDTAAHISDQEQLMQTVFAGLFLILLLAVAALTLIVARYFTRPLLELQKGSEAVGRGDLGYRVDVATGDEFENLARSFNRMTADLSSHIEELRRTTAENERMVKELEIAEEIQQSILPESAPALPGIELAGCSMPALEVGGDFYDYIPFGDARLGLAIADVSGKGVPAALFMALSRTLIRASALRNPDPAGAILEVNRFITLDSKTSMFVTLFYAVLDARERSFTYVNAGHNPPLLFRPGAGEALHLSGRGIALGILDEIELEVVRIELEPGDLLLLYTDGVTEAANEKDEEYGIERLEAFVSALPALPAEGIIDAIVKDVAGFAGTAPQFDDITLMVLKVA